MGHSRHSYPLDKRIPKGYKPNPMDTSIGYYAYGINNQLMYCGKATSQHNKVAKRLHKKKQRQYDRQLEKQFS